MFRLSRSTLNYWKNLIRLERRHEPLQPRVVAYSVTANCNLNCGYCEDFGGRRNRPAAAALPLAEALQVLRVIRGGVDALIFTGGEPLLHPAIGELVLRARQELHFRHLTLLTNGLLLPQSETLLPALDRLVVSLDSVDPAQWSATIQAPLETAQAIYANIRQYAARQREFGYRLIVNCVLAPQTLPGALALLDFCEAQHCLVSFSPQAVNNWPHYELLVSPAYRACLTELIARKRRGAPVLGSLAYLHLLRDFRPYVCYPTLVPCVLANGDLVYPCRPIEKDGGGRGGRPANLLQVSNWTQAVKMALAEYGAPPHVCTSCFQQCFAEPSLMQAQPLALLRELICYPASRQAGLSSYAPG